MPRPHPLLETLHALFTSLWLSALVGAGLGAAVVFPQMKSLAPALPEYAAYTGEHWKIAGGHVGMTLFAIADKVQIVCALCSVIVLAVIFKQRSASDSRGLAIARGAFLVIAAGLATYHVFFLAPRMMGTVQEFWLAAKAGDMAQAGALQSAFDADHPLSRIIMESTALAVAASLLLGVYDAARRT